MTLIPLYIIFAVASKNFSLPENLLSSLCYVESNHDISAVHHDDGNSDSLGVCQVKLSTARWMGYKGTSKQLMDPTINIYYAAKYLSYQIKRYHSTTRGIIAYNIGHAKKSLTSTQYSVKVNKQWRQECKTQSINRPTTRQAAST